MLRRLPVIALMGTCILLGLIVVRVATKKRTPPGRPSVQQLQNMQDLLTSFARIETRAVSPEEFSRAVHSRARNLGSISAGDREKLVACISKFYNCYSSGEFERFKEFRLRPPFTVGQALLEAVKSDASGRRTDLKSDEEVLHAAWDRFNGTNKVVEISESSLIVAVTTKNDLGLDLRFPPGVPKIGGMGASCWEGAVLYEPSPSELLKKEGSVRFFTLALTVRFGLRGGPATPLVLVGYWDPTRGDWMPQALCTPYQVGGYSTLF